MKLLKILTFLTLSLFCNITIRADIDYSQKVEITGAYDRIKITNDGLLLGENAVLYPISFYNGIYLSKDLNKNLTKKGMEGFRITDIDSTNTEIFATTYSWTGVNYPGLYKISKNSQNFQRIGRVGSLNRVLVFGEKVYYGGNNYGAWVVNTDGKNNKQLIGSDGYGPEISQIKANSKNVYILSWGNIYQANPQNDEINQIITHYKLSNIEPTENEILATSWDKFLILDFSGKIKFEKQFNYPIRVLKKYQNYLFLTEVSNQEQKIWISNDLGKNFYESKTKFEAGYVIRDIELTGTENISIFLNFTNEKVLKAKFKFDFNENKFLSVPFKLSRNSDLIDKITSYFDHRFPYLGNKTEPKEFSETTLNFYGNELKKPMVYYSSHDGIDFGLPKYTNILASEKGTAFYYFNPGGLGHYILISHPNNYLTVYGHLDEKDLITKTSRIVNKGEVIGKVGMSGNTNGPHLHLTVYKGEKVLENKVDPFGWQGNFEDPWVSKSNYLWDLNIPNLNSEVNLNQTISYSLENFETKFDSIANENLYHLTLHPVTPIYDRLNFKYKENTSYKLELSNLLNQKVITFATVKFRGFSNYDDEKKFSIYKFNGENIFKLETMFNPENSTLSSYTDVNNQFMVLENGFKKITTKSSFKTN